MPGWRSRLPSIEFERLFREGIRWPYQGSFEFPEANRTPPQQRHARNPNGKLFARSEKLDRYVACESLAETRFVEALDELPEVLFFFEQPVEIRYSYRGARPRYYPDFLCSFTDGRSVFVEVKQDRDLLLYANAAKWVGLASYCERHGYGFYVGDATDSAYRLMHRPVSVDLCSKISRRLVQGPLPWEDLKLIQRDCGEKQRSLLAAVFHLRVVVEDGYVLRLPTVEERKVFDSFHNWMGSVNDVSDKTAPEVAPVVKHQRPKPNNAYAPWTDQEEQRLLAEFARSTDIYRIAESMGRTRGAIRARLERLGQLEPTPRRSSSGSSLQ